MSSINVRKFVKEFKPIEIKQPFKTDVIEFTTTDDFTKYYREHEDDFNNISTYKLNVKYKIPGYKISKKGKKSGDKCEIILVKDYHYIPPNMSTSVTTSNIVTNEMNSTSNFETNNEQINVLQSAIADLEKRISHIENYLATDN